MAISTVSFWKTPQAGDDSFTIGEDSSGLIYLNVMANDLGGAAKSLYSLDDGQPADLFTQDKVGVCNYTANGNEIYITSKGQVALKISATNLTAYNTLAANETRTDSFVYAIRLANGTLSWASVTINVAGQNDKATITSIQKTGNVVEDGPLAAFGTITVADVDHGEAHALNDKGDIAHGSYTVSDSTWSFATNNAAIQFLGAGETVIDSFTVKSADGTASETVSITITGVNDGVTIGDGANGGNVVEDTNVTGGDVPSDVKGGGSAIGTLSTGGSFSFDDVDTSDLHTATVTNGADNALGGALTASVTEDAADGAGSGSVPWTYTVNNAATQYLAEGETATETFAISVDDDHGGAASQTISVTVTGVNDAVTLDGSGSTGGVTEDDATPALSTTGTIGFNDADLIDVHTALVGASPDNALGGSLVLGPVSEDDATSGGTIGWTYTVDNAATQFLAAGESALETFAVTIDDGHGSSAVQTVTVTVAGVNDIVIIGDGDTSGTVVEDTNVIGGDVPSDVKGGGSAIGTLSTGGSFSFDDADTSDLHAASVSNGAGNALGGTLIAAVTEDGAGSGSVAWTYTVDNAATQSLAEGEDATETFTIFVDDSQGGAASQVVTVTVTGVNDAATISGASKGDVDEDGGTTSGVLFVQDVDDGQAHTLATAAPIAGDNALGTYTVDDNGNWTYAANEAANAHLAAGDTAIDTFTVASQDGTASQLVTVTIHGQNDAATITGTSTGAVTEDGTLKASGTLAVSDVDDGEAVFVAQTGGLYGAFSLGTDGNWSYDLNNADTTVQGLNAGQTLSETFTVQSADGTSQAVKVTINGASEPVTNKAPTDIAFNITQSGNNGNWGFFSATDPDAGDSFTWSISKISGPDTLSIDTATGALSGGSNASTNKFIITVKDSGGATYSENYKLMIGANGNNNDFLFLGVDGTTDNGIAFGLNGEDPIQGTVGVDFIVGGAQNDTIIPKTGADVMQGGTGIDRFRFTAANDSSFTGGIDTILDFGNGSDVLQFSTSLLPGISLAGPVANSAAVPTGAIGWVVGTDTTVFANTSGGMMEILLKGTPTLGTPSFGTF